MRHKEGLPLWFVFNCETDFDGPGNSTLDGSPKILETFYVEELWNTSRKKFSGI